MVKCGPKPRKLTSRQIRNLVREEKRNLSLQHQAAQAPPSPRKKVWVRPSQFNVSLARKKRVKNYPRQMVPRKARSATSIAFSAITEEIPLFEELKRTNRLVYVRVPQQPVPLVWPQTPTRETSHVSTVSSIATIAGPATPIAKCEYHGIPSGLAPNISPGRNTEQRYLLSPPIASSTPLGTPSCAVVQVLSPAYIEDKLQNVPSVDEGVFYDETAIVTSSPRLSTVITHTGSPAGIQCVSASQEGSPVSRVLTFSWTAHGQSNILADRLLESDSTYKEEAPQPQHSGSPCLDNPKQCHKRIVLPTIRPLVIQRRAQNLQPSHILSQLPIEHDPDAITFPRVQLPRTVLRSPAFVNQSTQADWPETIYHRSLIASFWAGPSGSPNVKDQSRLEDAFPVLQDSDANPRVVSKSEQSIRTLPARFSAFSRRNESLILATEKTIPMIERSPCSLENRHYSGSNLVQPDSMCMLQPIKSTPSINIKDSTLGSFRSKRRIFGTYRARNVLGIDRTAGAFANAILRQTGHLRQKDDGTPAAGVPVVQNCHPFEHNSTMVKHVKNTGIQDRYISSRIHGQPTPFNDMRYYLPSNGMLQSRAPTVPMDEPKVPLAPAAIIKDDPFRRPSMRPSRKRFFPTSRVLAYRTESNPYGQSKLHKTSSARAPLPAQQVTHAGRIVDKSPTHSQKPSVSRPLAAAVDIGSASLRRKGHWTKRVVVDDICHHVSTDSTDIGASNVSLQDRSDHNHVHALPSQVVHSQPQTTLEAIPPSESEQTTKKRVTTEFSKKGTVFMALKAVYNKLWA